MHYGGLGSVLEKLLTPWTDRHGGASEKEETRAHVAEVGIS